MTHPYLAGTRANWQRKHALTTTGDYEVCGIERRQGPGDQCVFYYPTVIYHITDAGRRVHSIVTKWNLDGSNALSNFEDLDMRTVLV